MISCIHDRHRFREGAAAIWALKWALLKSDTAFFSVFIGDALSAVDRILLALVGVVALVTAFALYDRLF